MNVTLEIKVWAHLTIHIMYMWIIAGMVIMSIEVIIMHVGLHMKRSQIVDSTKDIWMTDELLEMIG